MHIQLTIQSIGTGRSGLRLPHVGECGFAGMACECVNGGRVSAAEEAR